MSNDSKTITLKHPVEDETGQSVSVLTMRAPLVRDMVATGKKGQSDEEKEVGLVASLCGVSPETIGKLRLGDYKSLQKGLQDFLS